MGKFQYNEALASLGNNLANAILMKRQREEDEQRKAETEFNISRYLQALMPQEQLTSPLTKGNETVNQGMAGIQGQQQNQALAQLLASGQGQQLATIMQLKKMQQPDWREVGTAQTGIDLYDPSNPSVRKRMFEPVASTSQQPNSIFEAQIKVAEAKKNGDVEGEKYWQGIIDNATERDLRVYGSKREITNEGIENRGFNSAPKKISTYYDKDNNVHVIWQYPPDEKNPNGRTEDVIESSGMAATSSMREKGEARKLVGQAIGEIKPMADALITEVNALAQKMKSTADATESILGNNPKYIAYRDSRMALAGNLAVQQQGSRPSDADIKAIWLPLIPDVFRDTKESAQIKWNLINALSKVNPTNEQGVVRPIKTAPSKIEDIDNMTEEELNEYLKGK